MPLVALDTTALSLFLNPDARPPDDPSTGQPVERARARIEHLIEELEDEGARILIPATVWAEFLVIADESGPDYLAEITNRASFEIVPFDAMAAVEAGAAQRKALRAGNKKADLAASRQCVKADRQIVAIAKTAGAESIIAGDTDIAKIGAAMGVRVRLIWDLRMPPEEEAQLPFSDEEPAPQPSSASTGPPPPSEQFEPGADRTEPQPEPGHPSGRPGAGGPQQPGSSPAAPPKPPSA